jgi:hypothetical protein
VKSERAVFGEPCECRTQRHAGNSMSAVRFGVHVAANGSWPCGRERRTPDAGYDKARLYQPGLVIPPLAPTSLRRDNLAELALERLVDFPREVRIELAELGGFRDKALVRALDVVALDLNRLF